MAQIINDPSFGASIGSALETGIPALFRSLAESKARTMLERQQQNQQQQSGNQLQALLEELNKDASQQGNTQENLGALGAPKLTAENASQIGLQNDTQQANSLIKQPAMNKPTTPNIDWSKFTKEDAKAAQQMILQKKKDDQLQMKQKQVEEHFEKKMKYTEEAPLRKENVKYFTKLQEESKIAEESMRDLAAMEELSKNGKLDSRFWIGAVKSLEGGLGGIGSLAGAAIGGAYGGPIGAMAGERAGHAVGGGLGMNADISGMLLSPDTQTFEKHSASFVRGAKQFFGSRITDREIQLFMKTIPTISQDPVARERLTKLMQESAKLTILTGKLANKIIGKSGNIPLDFRPKLDKLLGKKKDALVKKFVEISKLGNKPDGGTFDPFNLPVSKRPQEE